MAQPNFIFILTDDQGWEDLGSFGHPYLKTPHLDRLAKEGTSFTQSYVSSPVCSPSRVSFMTGHYPARHNVHHIYRRENRLDRMREEGVPPFLDPDTTTLTGVLQDNGYAIGHFGKWHMGNLPGAPPPSDYGIDEFRAFGTAPKYEGWPDWKDEEYWWAKSTDLFVDETIDFIDQNKDRPFYVNLWSLIPHARLNPTPEQLVEYEDLTVHPDDFQAWMRPYLEEAENVDDKMKVYCASMTSLDTAIGRLLDYLDETGLADNTFIFFTSDNGPEDYCVGNASNAGVGSPGEGRARKRSIYEGGVRTPAITRWPGQIPADRIDDQSVIGAVDWFPTVCAAAGVEMPDIEPDGEDIRDILSGTSRPRQTPLFWEWKCNVFGDDDYHPPELAIRDGDWKLFMNPDESGIALYNLAIDPAECDNVADEHPEIVARLKPQLADWKATLPDGYQYNE